MFGGPQRKRLVIERAVLSYQPNVLVRLSFDLSCSDPEQGLCSMIAGTYRNRVPSWTGLDLETSSPLRGMFHVIDEHIRLREQSQKPAVYPVRLRKHSDRRIHSTESSCVLYSLTCTDSVVNGKAACP